MTYAEELQQEIRRECTRDWPPLSVTTGSDADMMADTVIVGAPDSNRCLLVHFKGAPAERRYDLAYLPTRSTKVPAEREVRDYTHDQMLAAVLDFLKVLNQTTASK